MHKHILGIEIRIHENFIFKIHLNGIQLLEGTKQGGDTVIVSAVKANVLDKDVMSQNRRYTFQIHRKADGFVHLQCEQIIDGLGNLLFKAGFRDTRITQRRFLHLIVYDVQLPVGNGQIGLDAGKQILHEIIIHIIIRIFIHQLMLDFTPEGMHQRLDLQLYVDLLSVLEIIAVNTIDRKAVFLNLGLP